MLSRRRFASKMSEVAVAVDDDRRARSQYANIARQQGKRTAKKQKKEKTRVRRFYNSDRSAIRGIGGRKILHFVSLEIIKEKSIKEIIW